MLVPLQSWSVSTSKPKVLSVMLVTLQCSLRGPFHPTTPRWQKRPLWSPGPLFQGLASRWVEHVPLTIEPRSAFPFLPMGKTSRTPERWVLLKPYGHTPGPCESKALPALRIFFFNYYFFLFCRGRKPLTRDYSACCFVLISVHPPREPHFKNKSIGELHLMGWLL